MSKPTYEVMVRRMDGEMMLASTKGEPGVFGTVGEAEALAIEVCDSDEIMYAYVVQRRVSKTLKGKGLIQKEVRDGKKTEGTENPDGDNEFPEQGFAETS